MLRRCCCFQGVEAGNASSLVPGQAATCLRCGPDGCNVFVPSRYDANACQCGHSALYHRMLARNVSALGTGLGRGAGSHAGSLGQPGASPLLGPASMVRGSSGAPFRQAEDDDDGDDAGGQRTFDRVMVDGWNSFQAKKGLERSDEVGVRKPWDFSSRARVARGLLRPASLVSAPVVHRAACAPHYSESLNVLRVPMLRAAMLRAAGAAVRGGLRRRGRPQRAKGD